MFYSVSLLFCILVTYDSDILSENKVKTLFALVKDLKNFSLCWKYDGTFEEEEYRKCLNKADSLTIIRDSSDSFGVFNDLNQTESFGFDCRNDDECKKLATGMDPICIEDDDNDCDDDVDLIIKNFGTLKYRFKPLWSDNDYDISKIEVLNVY